MSPLLQESHSRKSNINWKVCLGLMCEHVSTKTLHSAGFKRGGGFYHLNMYIKISHHMQIYHHKCISAPRSCLSTGMLPKWNFVEKAESLLSVTHISLDRVQHVRISNRLVLGCVEMKQPLQSGHAKYF